MVRMKSKLKMGIKIASNNAYGRRLSLEVEGICSVNVIFKLAIR